MLSNGCAREDSSESLELSRESNQSILKEVNPEYSLEGLTLKLRLQYFGCLMWRTDSFEKTPMLGQIEGRRRRGWQRMRWLDGITDSMDKSLSKLWEWWWTGRPGMRQSMGLQRVRAAKLNYPSVGPSLYSPLTVLVEFLIELASPIIFWSA